ncbi:MAG: hypothetical protein MUP85_09800 [Candidatus Lokiarchaeota archaeon]|nr:hypothetical protein [Candidatus Lokiarchaeota archaeon]
MKKLFLLSFFFMVFGLLFMGCQGTEDITSPVDGLSKRGIAWGDPTAENLPYTVPLIAGQHNPVGTVTVERFDDPLSPDDGLKVTYSLNGQGCTITEVHVDLANKVITTNPYSFDFHVNSQNSPLFGHFDSKDNASIEYFGDEAVVTFTAGQVALALGYTPTVGDKIYIAAHSEVCCPEGSTVFASICPPDLVSSMGLNELQYAGYTAGLTSYFKGYFDQAIAGGLSVLDGWCVDGTRHIYPGVYDPAQDVNFFCSYDASVVIPECLIENPSNLYKVNWIINHRASNWGWMEVQTAIWQLLNPVGNTFNVADDPSITQEILDAVANLPYWEPTECDQRVLVIAYQGSFTSTTCDVPLQVMAFEVPVSCVPGYIGCETAMGFPYPFVPDAQNDLRSSLFPGSQWFRYFAFNY